MLTTRRYTSHSAQTTGSINLMLKSYWKVALLILVLGCRMTILNDEKTELLIIGTPQQLQKVVITHIREGNTSIHPVPVARNLD